MSSVELLLRHTLCARHTSRCELIALRGVLAPHTGQVAKEERSAARCCASTRGGDGAAASSSIWSRRGSDGTQRGRGSDETQRGRGSDETQRDRGSDETQRGRLAHELKKRGLAWLNALALCGRARARRRADAPLSAYTRTSTRRLTRKGWVPTVASKVRVASAAMACASSFFAGGQAT